MVIILAKKRSKSINFAIIAVVSQNERQQGIHIKWSTFIGQKMLFRASEITLWSCDTMAGEFD